MKLEHQKYMKENESNLNVNEGVEQPPNVSTSNLDRFKKRKNLTVKDYVNGILSSNRVILGQAITLIESNLDEHQIIAQEIINACLPHSGNSIRLGITGVPGVGKSTFIEALGKHITGLDRKIAVLAIDPSSNRSKGSILGDKTRMEELAVDKNAFIRASPSAGSLGGVAQKTRETIILCEAAGFDTILVETVGVGQSEIAVHSMVDFFLLLMLSNAGDELQGIKRGIMEMSDALFINKADGDNINNAKRALVEYQNALHLFPKSKSGWVAKTGICSAFYKQGIDEIWTIVTDYCEFTKANGFFKEKRSEQEKYRMHETINNHLHNHFFKDKNIRMLIEKMEEKVMSNQISAYSGAEEMLNTYFNSLKK